MARSNAVDARNAYSTYEALPSHGDDAMPIAIRPHLLSIKIITTICRPRCNIDYRRARPSSYFNGSRIRALMPIDFLDCKLHAQRRFRFTIFII